MISRALYGKLRIAAASALGFLVLAELALRAFDFRLPPARPPIVIWNVEEDDKLAETDNLHERSATQLWTPRPDALVEWGRAQAETINAQGYRGPALAREKTPGVLRIAVLGDSSTFGMGVPWRDTYGAQLVAALAARGVQAEVLDAGVIGFTLEQGLHRYAELVREYRPDWIVAAFGAVNEHLPTRDFDDRDKIRDSMARSQGLRPAFDWLRRNLRVLHFAAWIEERVQGVDRGVIADHYIEERGRRKKLEASMGAVEWPGLRRVSLAQFRESLAELCRLAHADGAQVVLVSMPRHADVEKASPVLLEYNRAVEEVGAAQQVAVFDFRGAILAALASGTPWDQVFVDHYHPNGKGHAILAAGLADRIAPSARKPGG